jgi:transposase
MPPAYVKPYLKRQKNDSADAEAICEAVTRANMRFVPTKTTEQQSCLMLHRTRHLFIRQQTAVINAIRAHFAEFGIVAPVGRTGVEELLKVASDGNDKRLPDVARVCIAALGAQLQMLKARILEFDGLIMAWHRSNQVSKRLDELPGVGPALATALVASVADPKVFRSGRDFSAWIGLVPKQNSSGGKNNHTLPHHEVRCAPQQNLAANDRDGSKRESAPFGLMSASAGSGQAVKRTQMLISAQVMAGRVVGER